jgi:hypothetical protein
VQSYSSFGVDRCHAAPDDLSITSAKDGAVMERMSSVVSDVLNGSGAEIMPPAPEAFSFMWLESCIEQYLLVDDEPIATRLDRYAFAGAILFGGLGLIISQLFRNEFALRALQLGFALELLCLAVASLNACRQAWRFYQRQHKEFAQDLDEQLVPYNGLVDAVRRYPLSAICTHLRYVRDRKGRLAYRAGLISGGFEKFGILPLLAAMYLQFKDWSFGDWKALTDHVHAVGGVLLWGLMVFYAVSWWAVRTKGRLDLYEVILTEASARESDT